MEMHKVPCVISIIIALMHMVVCSLCFFFLVRFREPRFFTTAFFQSQGSKTIFVAAASNKINVEVDITSVEILKNNNN